MNRAQAGPTPRLRTSLPSGLATAATWNPELAQAGGAMIGNEAFLSGFNVQLAGGMNLIREPRNGRNFEYGGEDPLLAGIITGHEIRGIQSQHVVSTMKHYAFNDQETNRMVMDHRIGEQAGRQSDLLAFEFANEVGQPGSVIPTLGITRQYRVVEYRGIEPQEYDPLRIVFRLDAAGNIQAVDCG